MKDPNAHDTEVKSVAKGPHPQADDAINSSSKTDPNLSGYHPTETPYTWLAGRMEGWQENDDYRTFFEKGKSADGLFGYGHDNDYDDNGGLPTAVGEHHGY